MENQSNPRAKKSKKNLKVSFLPSSQALNLHDSFEVVTGSSISDVLLNVDDHSIYLKSNLEFSGREIILSEKNLTPFLTLLEKKKRTSDVLLNCSSDNTTYNRLPANSSKKFHTSLTKHSKKIPTNETKKLLTVLEDDTTLGDLHSDTLTIQTFLNNFFDLSFFKSFTTIQLLLHEKGKNEAESHIAFTSGEYKQSNILVNSFAQAFQAVKKSKTKIFNNFQSQHSLFEVLGPFLAKEFELQNFSYLLIISRDGFLPVTDEDHQYLNSIAPILKSIFLSIIVKTKFSERKRSLLCSLNFFPEPIIIKVANNIVFKNKSYIDKTFDRSLLPSFFDLGHEKSLLVWQLESEDTITDLGHFQRISLLGELLNTLKHELSNPLFGLSLSSELLSSGTLDPDGKDFLNSISDSTKRCNEIIMNFSNFYLDSREPTSALVHKIILEVFTLSKSETRGIKKTLKFQDELDETLTIRTNPTLVSQILFNLVINSAQAISDKIKDPKIQVLVSIADEKLIISVSDNGPELQPSELEKIFKPFYTTKTSGTGLGLSICKKLAKRLGGELQHNTNKPFPGLTFSLVLPY